MRDLNQVLNAIVKQIPNDFDPTMERCFDSVRKSIPYTAPESMPLRWEQCADILMDYLPQPKADWQKTIAKIFNAEVDYKEFI